MTAYSRAAKRAKKKGIRKQFRDQDERDAQRQPPEPAQDARETVLQARGRLLGREVAPDLLLPLYGDPAGRAIGIGAKGSDEAQKLWGVFARFDSADETYFRRIIGRPRFAAVARMEIMPETFETRSDDRPDYRSDAEKDRDAVSAWMRWRGYLGCLSGPERTVIMRSARRTSGDLQRGGKLTTTGMAFVAAMRELRRVVEAG